MEVITGVMMGSGILVHRSSGSFVNQRILHSWKHEEQHYVASYCLAPDIPDDHDLVLDIYNGDVPSLP